ncbi:MAG: peptidoglycan DD-metalloendopeptidase family protein [Pseudomonadota bacterium]
MRNIISLILVLMLTGCAHLKIFGVQDSGHIEPIPNSGVHRVVHGETIYSIAWRYGLDYQQLARRNGMVRSKMIYSGEIIYLRGYSPRGKKLAAMKHSSANAESTREPTEEVKKWYWPARGPVIGSFYALNKGINIAGHQGDPIYASAAGKVVYSGNGLRSYGNLIIIKHNSMFLTAYAHNYKDLVHEGEWVKPGQEIAEMGNTGTNRTMLHFEIRKSGEPVNPLNYLENK